MERQTLHTAIKGPCHLRSRGFSFTEILFAVMILGIGFIMVAAMFPVAIRQTELTNGEGVAASSGREAFSVAEEIAGKQAFYQNATRVPPTLAPVMSPKAAQSILPPTFTPLPLPIANLLIPPAASNAPITLPGQVWSFFDVRDQYTMQPAVGSPPAPPATPVTPVPRHNRFLWSAVANNIVLPSDPRFGWVWMYRRDLIVQNVGGVPVYTPASTAQIIIIGVRASGTPAYQPFLGGTRPPPPSDVMRPTNVAGRYATLEPRQLDALLSPPAVAGLPTTIQFTQVYRNPTNTTASPYTPAISPAAEGAYVVVSDDFLAPTTDARHGMFNGRIYRLGSLAPNNAKMDTWTLIPGDDMSVNDYQVLNLNTPNMTTLPVHVLMVGRQFNNTTNQFSGGAQDLTAYTTFIPIPN